MVANVFTRLQLFLVLFLSTNNLWAGGGKLSSLEWEETDSKDFMGIEVLAGHGLVILSSELTENKTTEFVLTRYSKKLEEETSTKMEVQKGYTFHSLVADNQNGDVLVIFEKQGKPKQVFWVDKRGTSEMFLPDLPFQKLPGGIFFQNGVLYFFDAKTIRGLELVGLVYYTHQLKSGKTEKFDDYGNQDISRFMHYSMPQSKKVAVVRFEGSNVNKTGYRIHFYNEEGKREATDCFIEVSKTFDPKIDFFTELSPDVFVLGGLFNSDGSYGINGAYCQIIEKGQIGKLKKLSVGEMNGFLECKSKEVQKALEENRDKAKSNLNKEPGYRFENYKIVPMVKNNEIYFGYVSLNPLGVSNASTATSISVVYNFSDAILFKASSSGDLQWIGCIPMNVQHDYPYLPIQFINSVVPKIAYSTNKSFYLHDLKTPGMRDVKASLWAEILQNSAFESGNNLTWSQFNDETILLKFHRSYSQKDAAGNPNSPKKKKFWRKFYFQSISLN